MGCLPHEWVPHGPARALEMLAAGYGAERELRDHLAKGFAGDRIVLRWGTS